MNQTRTILMTKLPLYLLLPLLLPLYPPSLHCHSIPVIRSEQIHTLLPAFS